MAYTEKPVWLTDWLTAWLTDWLTDWMTAWLTDWLTYGILCNKQKRCWTLKYTCVDSLLGSNLPLFGCWKRGKEFQVLVTKSDKKGGKLKIVSAVPFLNAPLFFLLFRIYFSKDCWVDTSDPDEKYFLFSYS